MKSRFIGLSKSQAGIACIHADGLESSRSGQNYTHSASRRDSTASSIHSIGGTLDTSSNNASHSVYESGQNGRKLPAPLISNHIF